MIFCFHFAFIMFGYCSNGLLLGRYMLLYGNATELDLGFVFMIHPLAMFARPLICAHADRFQSHKKTLFISLLINSLAYTPFIAIPYILRYNILTDYTTPRAFFWILLASHAIGSVAFCGVRSLGDALAVNYAKKVGQSFGDYRKYGALGYGIAGFLLGNINQNWYLPDYVPAVVTNVISLFANSLIIYNAPDDYFRMVSESACREYADDLDKIGRNSTGNFANIPNITTSNDIITSNQKSNFESQYHQLESSKSSCKAKQLKPTSIDCNKLDDDDHDEISPRLKKSISGYLISPGDLGLPIECSLTRDSIECIATEGSENKKKVLIDDNGTIRQLEQGEIIMQNNAISCKRISAKQQFQIFLVLMEYDLRIPLFFLLLFLGGLLGYAPPNFVFTYMDKVCSESDQCNSAFLSGLTMLIYCCVETLCYIGIRKFCTNMGHALRLQITLVSLAFHFFFYAFALRHLSPYFFLIETLHGLEYSISLTSSVELGYKFANEVGLLIPELLRRGIITNQDDREMVRLSLTATMNSCFTLIYEGAGTMAGVLIYGLILDLYSFETVWLVIGISSTCGLILVSLVILGGRCLKIEPKILQLGVTDDVRNIVLA